MAHLSLYRKFRPSTFEQMVRQEHVVTVLRNQIAGDSVGHAYLFCGPRGTGKTSVARIFARAVNCENPVNGSPCGRCAACAALAEGSNLDIAEIDAASNNGVNEMRDLREKVQYPPVSGRYKVYIIDEVHMLTDSAFNALLKTLEEPPRHAIFILATTEPQKIPATILSRCMRLDFKLIPQEDLEKHLCAVLDEIGKSYEREAVSAIARAGAGSDRDMLSIAEMCIAYGEKLTYEGVTAVLGAADFNQTSALCRAILGADLRESLALTEKILSEGKAVGVLCRDILQFLNQLAVAKTCKNAEKLLALPKTLYGRVAEIAAEADGHAILRATEIFAGAEATLRFVSSPSICLETAVMKASMPAVDYNIDALLARVGALEKTVASFAENGVSAAAPKAEAAAPERRAEDPVCFSAPREEDYGFPEEEPVFAEADFSDEPAFTSAPEGEKPVPAPKAEEKREAPKTEPAAPVSAVEMTAEVVFGKFMRTLRKTSRNGVLFTMCSDLEAVYEGGTLALYTESETVYRSLLREEHREIMAGAFSLVGVADFCVKLKGAVKRDEKAGLEQIKRDFSDYPIEIK